MALYTSSTEQLITWNQEVTGDVVLVRDIDQLVFQEYNEGGGRPQYVVIGSDMTILLKTTNKDAAEEKVLELLD